MSYKYRHLQLNKKLINPTAVVTNITNIDNNHVAISFSNNHNTIIIFKIKDDGNNLSAQDGLSTTLNIRFLGKINNITNMCNFDDFVVIPKQSFELLFIQNNFIKEILPNNNFKKNNFNLNGNIEEYFITTIKHYCLQNINISACNHKECYHLIGFVELYDLNFLVQHICMHSQNSKHLFILRTHFNTNNFTISDASVLNHYNLTTLYNNYNLDDTEIKKSIITSVCNNDDEIIFITTSGRHGRVWKIPFYSSLLYFGFPELKFSEKLENSPRGICCVNDKIYVACNNKNNNKLTYMVI